MNRKKKEEVCNSLPTACVRKYTIGACENARPRNPAASISAQPSLCSAGHRQVYTASLRRIIMISMSYMCSFTFALPLWSAEDYG